MIVTNLQDDSDECIHGGRRADDFSEVRLVSLTRNRGRESTNKCTMGRSKTAACKLLITVEEIRNLPKVNKGSGGADPYGVLEILDASGIVLVGGDRELYCAGCKTKVMKKSLDGYVTERFELGGDFCLNPAT